MENKVKLTAKELKEKKEELEKLIALPKYEAVFTLADVLDVNNFRASHTVHIDFKDPTDGKRYDAEKCDVSDDSICAYGLSLGLKSIEGEKVTDDNLMVLLEKHLKIIPNDIIRLYNDMFNSYLKKK